MTRIAGARPPPGGSAARPGAARRPSATSWGSHPWAAPPAPAAYSAVGDAEAAQLLQADGAVGLQPVGSPLVLLGLIHIPGLHHGGAGSFRGAGRQRPAPQLRPGLWGERQDLGQLLEASNYFLLQKQPLKLQFPMKNEFPMNSQRSRPQASPKPALEVLFTSHHSICS